MRMPQVVSRDKEDDDEDTKEDEEEDGEEERLQRRDFMEQSRRFDSAVFHF